MSIFTRTLRIAAALVCLALAGRAAALDPAAPREALPPIPSLYDDPAPFRAVIESERRDLPAAPFPVSGITVPHHLLAADLIARGVGAAQGNRYGRIVILSPDHFSRSRHPVATTRRDFETVFGPFANDREASGSLLADADLVEESDLFDKEHGIAAILPFLKAAFPEARIVPVVISYRARRPDWDRLLALIAPLVGPDTLVVQSTDYSHYLPVAVSRQRDQESLTIIAADDVEAVERLVASDHMDSKAAQYIQMRLQRARGSRATVIANRNSVEYIPYASRTTSYVVSVYSPERRAFPYRYPDQDIAVFGGDVFPGRYLTKPLADPEISREIVARVRELTGGAPMVVNLEGVLMQEPPDEIGPDLHAIPTGLGLPFLRALGVTAASLANNHSFDLGRGGYAESIALLKAAGITPLLHGESADLGPFRVVALNDVGRGDRIGYPVLGAGDLAALCRAGARPPLLALVHWGQEYAPIGTPQYALAHDLAGCGVGAVIGAHSHRAAEAIEAPEGGAYAVFGSLGNLVFDQASPRGSGALIEVRRFRQGTIALRLLPLPNLFDLANARLRGRDGELSAPAGPPR